MRLVCYVFACGLAAGLAGQVRPVPPPGVAVPAADKEDLEAGLKRLSNAIDALKADPQLVADVAIYRDAVRYALFYNEFFKPEEIGRAKQLLQQGERRALQLAANQVPWDNATGLVARGYVSDIDGSVQPYGLVVPPSYRANSGKKWRLDAWFHGRSETLSEVNFLWERQTRAGEFTPADTLVLHLYGRYCNANKLAGEVDLFEALEAVKKRYPIDENRIVVRGFSMGGAATWQFASHYAGLWAAAAPGAGFSETAEFLQVFEKETVKPTWWEQKLWRMYDATEYAANFYNLPLVAYSGEIDRQKQAADIMARYLEAEGLRMTHIIGPQTAHKYHPDAKVEIDRRLDAIAAIGRDPYPRKLVFTTFTLAYNRMKWLQVDGLGQHWERARVDAEVVDGATVDLTTRNVTGFTLDFGAGGCPLEPGKKATVRIDGTKVSVPGPWTDRSWTVHFRKTNGRWTSVDSVDAGGLTKHHGLQGPVDDAFLSRFIIVTPTGSPANGGVAKWVEAEQSRAIREWRRQFRGEPIVKKDTDITDADIAGANLILWGDPGSNRVLAKIGNRLPLEWTKDTLQLGSQRFTAASQVPIMIYPNPLNPKKYIVLNTGFTFREYDYLNNARQVPKLPDWAIVDTTTPPDAHWPGRIAGAGFFDESWRPIGEPAQNGRALAGCSSRALRFLPAAERGHCADERKSE